MSIRDSGAATSHSHTWSKNPYSIRSSRPAKSTAKILQIPAISSLSSRAIASANREVEASLSASNKEKK